MRVSRILCAVFVLILCSVSAAAAAKKPTVAGELKRLAADGHRRARGRRAPTAPPTTTPRPAARSSPGARYLELGGVIRDLEDMAARKQFTPSAPARAVPHAAAQRPVLDAPRRCPPPGFRTSFTGSELVYQFYPGHGMQIQWLGTFGKLNGYWSGGARYDARAGALLDEIKALATERAGGLAWEYLFPFDGQRPPWVSSLAQGTGLQAMARSATRLEPPGRRLPARARRA